MGIKYVVFVFVLLCCNAIVFSQTENDSIVYDIQTEYIEKFPNRITARLFYVNTSNSLKVNDRNSDLYFNLTPNKQNRIGASVSFRSLTISYSFAPNFLAENKDNENSKLFNLDFRNYFGRHWMQTLDLYQAKGFYLENRDINLYFPRIKSFKIGGATSYIFNENFSFRAIASQDEKQLKSTGSFIPRIVYYYTKLNIRGEDNSTDTELHTFDIVFAPSYYYNFVPTKNLFISAGVSAGIGLNYSKNEDNNHIQDDESLTSLTTELNFRGSLTYDISSFYLGTHYNYLILNHNTDRSSYVNDNIPFFQIFAGYRFRAPKKLVRKADDINEKIKL
ncbi:hypothetical protein C1T31_00820 [Hanstruepera neustonica]|uniref:DUF4421 domain-containing protein n=1 Tax=Hanstruepera neustonica TaxID=1445657 RepID=A0A2K1E346_9FLAO|nr:DUF4421 domain-containing protein [Hanstruepera neustonica]PNQ74716.1 hypothetical protein C1T31_00820 [Hanstruepera neustonica]